MKNNQPTQPVNRDIVLPNQKFWKLFLIDSMEVGYPIVQALEESTTNLNVQPTLGWRS